MLWYWLVPLQLAYIVSNVRGLAEHHGVEGSDDVHGSRSVVWSKLASYLILNVNFHLEHHLLPAIPWYNLHRAHRLLETDLAARGAEYRRSYIGFTADNLSNGPGALESHKPRASV